MGNSIPKSRLIIYLFTLLLFPIFLVSFNILRQASRLNELTSRMEELKKQALSKEKKQALNFLVRDHFRKTDHFYIDKHLESLTFLEPEIESLEMIVSNKNFAGDEMVKRRLEFLRGAENRLLFAEGNVQTFPIFQETIVSLVHSVEINLNDLKKILSLVEGVEIGTYQAGEKRPQLIILDFKLDKKGVFADNEVLILNMKLLKREFL